MRHLNDDQTAALDTLQTALKIFRQIGSRSYEAAVQTFLGHTLVATGQNEQAATAYREAVALRHELVQAHLIAEPQVCLALIALDQGRPAEALSLILVIVPQMIANDLSGIEDPLRVIWGCYHVLATLHDQRSAQVLVVAQEALRQRTALIHDPLLRERFLERTRRYWQLPARFAELAKP